MEHSMSSGIPEVTGAAGAVEHRTTEATCPACATSRSLDDDSPKLGTVSWEIREEGRLRKGRAVHFECPNGHSSDDDPALLKVFLSRLF